ncbi:MAG: hypothetical protein ABGX53_05980 [Candidatus Thioglobus sp.]
MPPIYTPHNIHISNNQHEKLKKAINGSTKKVTLRINEHDIQQNTGGHTILLTARQILKLQNAKRNHTSCILILRRAQIDANLKHEGGFLPLLAGLFMKALPALATGVLTGTLSGGISRLIKGDGYLLHKNKTWYKLTPHAKGTGLYLSPYSPSTPTFSTTTFGNGLFIRRGKELMNGSGLLLGPNSPFKNIPLLNLIL